MSKDNFEPIRNLSANASVPIPERENKSISDPEEFERRLYIMKSECSAALEALTRLERLNIEKGKTLEIFGAIQIFAKNFAELFQDLDIVFRHQSDLERTMSNHDLFSDFERLVEGVKRSEIEKTLSSRIEQMERFYGKSVDLDKYGKHLYTLVARLPNMMSKAESYLQQFKK